MWQQTLPTRNLPPLHILLGTFMQITWPVGHVQAAREAMRPCTPRTDATRLPGVQVQMLLASTTPSSGSRGPRGAAAARAGQDHTARRA